jgi:hypothetical protein
VPRGQRDGSLRSYSRLSRSGSNYVIGENWFNPDPLQILDTKENKTVPVTSRGGLCGYETSRLPHFLDSQQTDGG